MLSRRIVDHYASGMKIDTIVAEKDVVLTYVLKVLNEMGFLPNLAFKGGTCLKKIYYGKDTRFSEDLDFTAFGSYNVEQSIKSLEKTFNMKEYYGIYFEVKEKVLRKAKKIISYRTIIKYKHGWHNSQFTLDISYREKPALSITPRPLIKEIYFKDLEFDNFEVPTFQTEELMAEKIRAANQRLRPRDLYDLFRYSQKSYNKRLVKTLAVIKCWNANEPLRPKELLENIRSRRHNWGTDLKNLLRPKQIPNTRKVVNETANHYSYLIQMDNHLLRINEDAKKQKLLPEVEKILLQIK